MKKIFKRFKDRIQNFTINFKTKFKEYKQNPKLKEKSLQKSFTVGFATVLAIFGFTLFGPALAAVAKDLKDLPKGNPKFPMVAPVAPTPCPPPTTDISGLAASLVGLAISSGFAVGIICGFIFVVGIVHIQGKLLQ
jgi:hypothetical protein